MGERALVLSRAQVLAAGLLAPPGTDVPAHVAGRLPRCWSSRAAAGGGRLLRRPETSRRMIGVHGSLTPAEAVVPLVRAQT